MNGPRREFIVRRVVCAADSSPQGSAAIDAAVRLAERLRAQLCGVFVEDIDLVNLAQLSIGREFHSISGRSRDFDAAVLEAQLRREADRARQMLEDRARAAQVHFSFTVVRGRVEGEVVQAAAEGDLLVITAAGRIGGLWRRPGAAALEAARRAPRSILLLGGEARVPEHALVAFEGGDGGCLALDAAHSLVRDRPHGLTVALVAADEAARAVLRKEVEDHLGAGAAAPDFVDADALDPLSLCRLSRASGADLLVLSADSPALAGDAAQTLIETISCPVLLVR